MKQLEGINRMRTLVLALVIGAPAFAGENHCHSRDGKVEDDPSATNKQDCRDKGGLWLNHDDPHCHATGDGVTQDYPQATTQAQCTKTGGTWFGHGHDKL